MPTSELVEISKLKLDLRNFRTTPQSNEEDAIKAMIAIKPDWFYGLMDSLIEDGYLLTENIIILKDGSNLIVKEGNRRVGILKILHGYYKLEEFGLPSSLISKIAKIDGQWTSENLKVPCTIYLNKDADKVDKIIALAHGKGEKAGRDKWTSVARARHNRDERNASEPMLDLLEKYLASGKNLTGQQKDRWAGDYPLTVMDEAIKKIISRLGFTTSIELVKKYPAIKYRSELEALLRDIGLEQVGFPLIRNAQSDFAVIYGIKPIITPPNPSATNNPSQNTSTTTSPGSTSTQNPSSAPSQTTNTNSNQSTTSTGTPSSSNSGSTGQTTTTPPKAYAINDPRNVASILKKFNPTGSDRQKVVTLRDEIKKLKIKDNPIAFCFVLRSMFEISAKVYCTHHSIKTTKSDGSDKSLVDLLREITNHLTGNNSNKAMVKVLHGAMTEIGRKDGILSVTSMNQLVHNPSFSVAPPDICTLFGNVYQLLESMN